MLADDYDTSHHDSVNARLPNPFVCSRDSQRDAEEQFSKMFKKMMQKEKDTVNLNPDIEAYAVQRQGGYQRTNGARLGNQAPGMSRPQYPGGYGPAADRQAFEQQQQAYRPQYQYQYPNPQPQPQPYQSGFQPQGPYLGRRHTVQGDTRAPTSPHTSPQLRGDGEELTTSGNHHHLLGQFCVTSGSVLHRRQPLPASL